MNTHLVMSHSSLHDFVIIATVAMTDGKEDLRFVQTEIFTGRTDTFIKFRFVRSTKQTRSYSKISYRKSVCPQLLRFLVLFTELDLLR